MQTELFDKLIKDVKCASTLSSRQKNDISNILSSICTEIKPLSEENPEATQSIYNFLICVIFESTRIKRTNVLATAARKGMLLSFHPFEESYPKLVNDAYTLGDTLSALGI